MKQNSLIWIILIILIAGAGWFLVSGKGDKVSNPPVSNNQTKSSSTTESLPAGTFLVRGFNYGYSPADIVVKEGENVKIRLTSDDSPHTFTIDELGVNQQFTWGKDTDISFTAGKKGRFQFYCAVPGHKEGGMVGTLTVE